MVGGQEVEHNVLRWVHDQAEGLLEERIAHDPFCGREVVQEEVHSFLLSRVRKQTPLSLGDRLCVT